jgi:hypothetical protein
MDDLVLKMLLVRMDLDLRARQIEMLEVKMSVMRRTIGLLLFVVAVLIIVLAMK